jgi:hypothetical protein
MAVCCQNLTLGALSSRSALSVLVGAQFKKFGLFLIRVVEQKRSTSISISFLGNRLTQKAKAASNRKLDVLDMVLMARFPNIK